MKYSAYSHVSSPLHFSFNGHRISRLYRYIYISIYSFMHLFYSVSYLRSHCLLTNTMIQVSQFGIEVEERKFTCKKFSALVNLKVPLWMLQKLEDTLLSWRNNWEMPHISEIRQTVTPQKWMITFLMVSGIVFIIIHYFPDSQWHYLHYNHTLLVCDNVYIITHYFPDGQWHCLYYHTLLSW